MKKVTVKAIFKGKDGSLGYQKNTEYALIITHSMCANISIKCIDQQKGVCEYESMISFLKNWDNIRLA